MKEMINKFSHDQEEATSNLIQRETKVVKLGLGNEIAEEIAIPQEVKNNTPIINFNSCNVVFHSN